MLPDRIQTGTTARYAYRVTIALATIENETYITMVLSRQETRPRGISPRLPARNNHPSLHAAPAPIPFKHLRGDG